MGKIKVIVSGANGRMGREVMRAILKEDDLQLVGAVDVKGVGCEVGELLGTERVGLHIFYNLEQLIEQVKPDVMVDFTNPNAVIKNVKTAIKNKVSPVIGTTGLTEQDIQEIRQLCQEYDTSAFIAPNFSVGAVLMMLFAQTAAKYLPHVEIIELHHDQKVDAPSGTAVRTAELILQEREAFRQGHPNEYEKIDGARGGEIGGIRLHSVRLPGLVAHQEVIFGGLGQTLTIRHDSLSRESFMPGVILAIRKVKQLQGMVQGLENLLNM